MQFQMLQEVLDYLWYDFVLFSLQIAISNPNREVLLTLSRSGVVEMIGKEWYFVRVHDALQVCLQHVQSLKETPKTTDSGLEDRPSFFRRLLKRREDDSTIAQLESGDGTSPICVESDPQSEPLLSRKSWSALGTFPTALLPVFLQGSACNCIVFWSHLFAIVQVWFVSFVIMGFLFVKMQMSSITTVAYNV